MKYIIIGLFFQLSVFCQEIPFWYSQPWICCVQCFRYRYRTRDAIAILGDESSPVNGTVYFKHSIRSNGPMMIYGNVNGLSPNQEHGIHIHEYGDITNGCSSVGEHFNPTNQQHGAPNDLLRHVGDLGNIKADEDGRAIFERKDWLIGLHGIKNILGRSVVIHADRDDLGRGPDPSSNINGNSGPIVACGIIAVKNVI